MVCLTKGYLPFPLAPILKQSLVLAFKFVLSLEFTVVILEDCSVSSISPDSVKPKTSSADARLGSSVFRLGFLNWDKYLSLRTSF